MSGGVDSSVAAALMKEAGYDVIGIMLKLWSGVAANNESGCCSLDAAEDARRVAQVLDIPFYVFNFAEEFNATVVADFVTAYQRGATPNPCVTCNRSIKFAALARRARAVGAVVLATGHYARIAGEAGARRLLRATDRGKDQSYVLYMLDQAELALARFPGGEYSKPQVREIATQLGLRTAAKPESQEICFVPGGDLHPYLEEAVPEGSRPGPILTADGRRIGTHRGFAHYTVGQRRGLGVGVGLPLYVREVRAAENTVVVSPAGEMSMASMEISGVSFVAGKPPEDLRCAVMTRYRGAEPAGRLEPAGRGWRFVFEHPQPPAAAGQAAVFYRQDEVLGGGTIERTA
ncbi:MAG: tRNA 2-thiouridine(34) synthase MnmA [Actinomycetota bacterium]